MRLDAIRIAREIVSHFNRKKPDLPQMAEVKEPVL